MFVQALLAAFLLAAPHGALGASGLTVTMPKAPLEAARDGEIILPCTYTSTVLDRQNLYIAWNKQENLNEKPVIMYMASSKQTSVPDDYFAGRVSFVADVLANNVGIKITKLLNEDNGIYSCSVTNMPGTDSGHLTLIVLVAPSMPVFSIVGKPEIYQNVKLTCSCSEGSPSPTFSWQRLDANNNPIAMPIGAQSDAAAGTLDLKNVTLQASGLYECTATNKVGRSVTNGTLTVTYPQNNAMMYGIIIAAAAGGLLLLIGIISYCVWRRNRKRREEEGYYSDEQYEMEGQEDDEHDEKRGRRSPMDRDVPREKYVAVSRHDERSERSGERRYRDDDRDYSDSESRRGNGDTGQRRNRRDRYSDDSDDESHGRQSRQRRDRDNDRDRRSNDRDLDYAKDRNRDRPQYRDRDLESSRPYSRSRDRDLDRDLESSRPYSRSRDRDLDRDLESSRPYSRSRDRDLDRDLESSRPYSRSRDRDLDRDLDSDRPYSRSRERGLDSDRPYSRSRDRGLDRDDGEGSEYRGGRDDGSGFDDSHSEAASSTHDSRPRPPPNKPKINLDRIDGAANA